MKNSKRNRIILKAQDLDGYLNSRDWDLLQELDALYKQAEGLYRTVDIPEEQYVPREGDVGRIIDLYDQMGQKMQEITRTEPAIRVYSFETPSAAHGEVSRLIAKLRDTRTPRPEFMYYVQRGYELLFNLAFGGLENRRKNYLMVKTPVDFPVQNYAVHKIPNVDEETDNTVMCVMLRGALLPSMIVSKEIQEYSSSGYVSPFALFRIKRDDTKREDNMEYVLDLKRSYFRLEDLDGKDLVFADPMNATGGSLVTIVKYLLDQDVKPRSIRFMNIISALKGTLRIVRALEDVTVSTLWMDPVLNNAAYILPGLGDAGDRLNGEDTDANPRNLVQLIADYGADVSGLYRSQVRKIEETILG